MKIHCQCRYICTRTALSVGGEGCEKPSKTLTFRYDHQSSVAIPFEVCGVSLSLHMSLAFQSELAHTFFIPCESESSWPRYNKCTIHYTAEVVEHSLYESINHCSCVVITC